MKKFFVKQSRPSGREKQLSNEITELIRKAELDDNKTMLTAFENFGVVKDEQGLEKLLQAIKNGSIANGTPKEEKPTIKPQNHTDMNNETEKINEETEPTNLDNIAEEPVVFEPVINVHEESQFTQPVVERNPIANEFVSDNPNPEPELGDSIGGEKIDDGEFEPPQDDAGDMGGGGNLKDLPPETKRKAINSSAKVLATIYQGAMPMLPKMIAKVSERKLKKMEWNNEINPQMKIPVDTQMGRRMMTIQQYIHDYNTSIDETIQISDEMREEFQECLKDVLQEKQVAMTPTARLAGIVAMQAVALFSKSVELKMMMRDQMEMFKQWHDESKQNGGGTKPPQQKANPVEKKTEPVTPAPPTEEPVSDIEEDMVSINPDEAVVKK